MVGVDATPLAPKIAPLGIPTSFPDHKAVCQAVLAAADGAHAIVEVAADGTYRLLVRQEQIDLVALADNGLVYRYETGTERILVGPHEEYIERVSPTLLSNFATPTFASLDDALGFYGEKLARHTQCPILAGVWEGGVDGPRLVLKNKPEATMRDSLIHSLKLSIRDTSVRPEQNTDATKPVDIRVDWFGSRVSALIEIKWLGRATAISKTAGEQTYTNYSASRAQDGAHQLADYLDREARHSGANISRGYLAVFDARRRGVEGAADFLSKADALHFAKEDIDYNPDYSKARRDYAAPVRFFMEPRASLFLAQQAA